MKQKIFNQFKSTGKRIFTILAIGYGAYLATQIADGFIQNEGGKIAGYFAALVWYSLYCFMNVSNQRMIKRLFKLLDQSNELTDDVLNLNIKIVKASRGEIPQEKSPSGGIPSPFIKRIM